MVDHSALHTLGQIGEALLATGAGWQIRRLASAAGERQAPDRGALKQHLDELTGEAARVAVLVLLGSITTIGGEPALVTGGQVRDYPEDATLPLRWIGDRLRAARAEQLVAVVSARGADGAPADWLRALGTGRAPHVVAVAASPDDAHPIAGALLTALCGDALDPRTGTVTMASLSTYLERLDGAAVQASETSETLAQPPPLAGLWDVRRSQLSMRATRPRAGDDTEDLTGTVLPGRFRIDAVIARGTFGTVYRARQLAVERDVAVKVLHPDIDPASEDGRLFVHEVRSVGRLDHGNVVRIYQADITHDGRLFFAMELLAGHDLQEVGQSGPLPRSRAIELVRQLLAGLAAAHDAGLVHADVKPANAIVVERDGTERVVLVDFGLARLRAADRPAESAGGTPAYMAPEQMDLGRIDARSDLFSAALVLIYLLTGWRRPNPYTLTPPLELISDPELGAVLERALELEPARRYASARELIAALTGVTAPATVEAPAATPAPFRLLAPFTEDDRGRLFGREADLAALTQYVLYRRSVVYTAPSGTGKTSLLRAGLVPRLEALGAHAVYLRSRPDCVPALAAAIWPEAPVDADTVRASELPPAAPSVAAAVTAWHRQRGGKLVIILDQVEAALGDDRLVGEALGFAGWPADADVCVVLSIREDHLARLLVRAQAVEPGIPVVRLPPLGPAGARAAITGPLTAARLAIEPALLDALLADLQRAAGAIGPEMGWGNQPAVFPPHLQLAGSVLTEALDPGDAVLSLAHYQRLGGFDAIVGEHLERVLDTELTGGDDRIARALFVALVTASHERAMCPESELIAMVGDAERVSAVLEVLRARGLVVRVRGDDEPSWELAHDSLVPRVLAWVDARDLARRRAIELVRYHLRRSRPDAPSLLGRDELRELGPHMSAIAELDAEWRRRGSAEPWTPSRLIAQSRQRVRRQAAALALLIAVAVGVPGYSGYRSHLASQRQERELALRARNLGRFVLSIEPFDWDPEAQRATPAGPALLGLEWQLQAWTDDGPGAQYVEGEDVERRPPRRDGTALVEDVEARGGRAYLTIRRLGCAASLLPLKDLPGYAQRERPIPTFRIRVPSCAATAAGTIEVPAGPFRYEGAGTPPSRIAAERYPEQRIDLPRFWIDRTEVTNAAFAMLADMAALTGIEAPNYPNTPLLEHAADPRKPVTGVNWYTARDYCRYLGKDLPSSEQWVKAMRGGEQLPDGSDNPLPDRNYPFGIGDPYQLAALTTSLGISDVATHPGDRSPYGVLDMTGNAEEWTLTARGRGVRVLRGGGVAEQLGDALLDFMAIPNPRAASQPLFAIGERCVVNEAPAPPAAPR
ncbi:MAG TPA: bifunctional serine/threonine-protein kinase/formylglycine-generating enzyme family protein [Kofleriaceae bacterium]|nr:bifunctional serine/threonine-protein kinase/formylglycine-generating enzyme family protein [Kofleriaceae bacterium]